MDGIPTAARWEHFSDKYVSLSPSPHPSVTPPPRLLLCKGMRVAIAISYQLFKMLYSLVQMPSSVRSSPTGRGISRKRPEFLHTLRNCWAVFTLAFSFNGEKYEFYRAQCVSSLCFALSCFNVPVSPCTKLAL